jgi:hypothetical protein
MATSRSQRSPSLLSAYVPSYNKPQLCKQDLKFLKRQQKELKKIDNRLKDSVVRLRVAQNGLEDRDLEENKRLTGFELPRKRNRLGRLSGLDEYREHLVLSARSRKRSSLEQMHCQSERKPRKTVEHRESLKLSLPSLLSKFKSQKSPRNASRSHMLSQ